MQRLTLAEIERIRRERQSVLLFITDRCPVGCAHCSVSSRDDSPTIRDFELFERIVEALCTRSGLTTVAISGGEPFVERRGLALASEKLAAAGKRLVIYTSGTWANPVIPGWIPAVLQRVATVFLSTDAFHTHGVDDARFIRAALAMARAGSWIVVQVLEIPAMVERARRLLQEAFGTDFSAYGELSLTQPLPYGRGEALFKLAADRCGEDFGTCYALTSPVVRYDGVVTACCNEQVIVGRGPERLRRRCASQPEIAAALDAFAGSPTLKVIGGLGAGALTRHPSFHHLAQRKFSSICNLCWAAHGPESPADDETDSLLTAMTWMAAQRRR